MGPLILVMLVVINAITSPGNWWVKWAALGIGIAWVISLIRVLGAVVVLGGIAALVAYVRKQQHPQPPQPPLQTPPPPQP
jgi:predicted phage tail protein